MFIKKGIDLNKNVLDFEIFLEREEYIEKVNTKGTLEYKLNERFKHMSLNQFLKHTSK